MQGELILSPKCSRVFENHMIRVQMHHADQGVSLCTQHALHSLT